MGWKPIDLALFSQFQQCLQQKGIPDEDLDEISECFEQTFSDSAPDPEPEPEPEPPPTSFGPCGGNQSQRGTDGWADWCVDEQRNFKTLSGGVLGMESNGESVRSRLPNAAPRGIAPPTFGSNRVVMSCRLRFNEDWLRGINLGGQHLFKIGEGPYRQPNGSVNPDHIRFDFGCFSVDGGNGFRDGFRVLVYHQKGGQHQETWFPSTTRMTSIFVANVWTAVRADCRYDPATGRCDLDLTVGSTRRIVSTTVKAGIIPKIGDSVGWGNVDQREGVIEIDDLEYRTS